MEPTVINVLRDFSRFPAGRYLNDGPYSGERFREELLIPALERSRVSNGNVVIELDGARGYGSSFLEEAFAGLLRRGFGALEVSTRTEIRSSDPTLIEEIRGYIADQAKIAE